MHTEKPVNDIDLLIARLATDISDKEALAAIQSWCGESEERRRYASERLEVLFSSGVVAGMSDFDPSQGWERLSQRILAEQIAQGLTHAASMPTGTHQAIPDVIGRTHRNSKSAPGHRSKQRRLWRYMAGIAAALAIVLLPWAGYHTGREQMKSQFADIRIETPLGAPMQMQLPDGTQVWLGGGSTLVYSQGFGVSDRRLSIQGEGCFDVAHNDRLAFEIHAHNGLDLKVLGTRFTFKNYEEDPEMVVDLIRGKVFLRGLLTGQEMTLDPNERMTLDKQTGAMVKTRIKASRSDCWTRGVLFFDELPLAEIAKTLSRHYNVRIDVAKDAKEKSFYGNFETSQCTLDDILSKISQTKHMQYTYQDGKYLLY